MQYDFKKINYFKYLDEYYCIHSKGFCTCKVMQHTASQGFVVAIVQLQKM